MIHEIVGYILVFGLALLLSIILDYKRSLKNWYLLLLFLVIGCFDNLCYTITTAYPSIQIIKTNIWNNYLECNWSAKIYSIIFALIILFLFKNISRDDIGLSLKHNKDSIRFSLFFILFFFGIAIIVGLLGRKGDFDTNTLVYLAIMPGLNEELIYRGFLLGILNKIFDRKFILLRTRFGWGAIITSIIFGLLHGFQLTGNYQIQIVNLPNVLLTGIFGFIFSLMKERSGSLVFPIIGHSTIDFFHYLIRMV